MKIKGNSTYTPEEIAAFAAAMASTDDAIKQAEDLLYELKHRNSLAFWPIETAVHRLIDLDRRSKLLSPRFIKEFDELTPTEARSLYHNAHDSFLADFASSPDSSRLTKARTVIDVASQLHSIEGLDGIFFTALGFAGLQGDKPTYRIGEDLIKFLTPQTKLGGNQDFTLVFDAKDRCLKSLSLDGLNSLIGTGTNAKPENGDTSQRIDRATAYSPYSTSSEEECKKRAKKIGDTAAGIVGGYVGGAAGAAAGAAVGGTIGWIVGGPYGAVPGAGVGAAVGAAAGSAGGKEAYKAITEEAIKIVAEKVCGSSAPTTPPASDAQSGQAAGSASGSPAPAPGADPPKSETPAPSPSPSPPAPPSPSPTPSSPSAPSPPSPTSPPAPPGPPQAGGPGDDDDDDDEDKNDAVVRPVDPELAEKDPTRHPPYGTSDIVTHSYPPDAVEPRSTGKRGTYDMVGYPRIMSADGDIKVQLGEFAELIAQMIPTVEKPPISIGYPTLKP